VPLLRRLAPLALLTWLPPASALADSSDEPSAPDPMPVPRGLQLGARLGYSLPVGPLASNPNLSTSLSNLETATVPIGIDAGYRFSPSTYLGGTLAWGPGIAPNSQGTCGFGDSCFRQDAQLRVDGRLYLAPDAKKGGWLGLGVGWEIAAFSDSHLGHTITSTLTGPVFADLELGLDFRRDALAIGPYIGVTLAEFVTEGVNPATAPVSTSISDPSIHAWVTLGLRGSYGPW
jgi:hypothetical protein